MNFRPVLLFIAALVSALGLAHAAAQNANRQVFIVPEVPVYAEAETAAAAQRIAQDRGRRRAMDILLRRLTAEEDWQYLPTLATGEPANAGGFSEVESLEAGYVEGYQLDLKSAVNITTESLAAYEEGFSIFDEKTSSTTYRASITYRFKPDAVRRALEAAGLPYSEAQARRALVLPVLETENGSYLWETRNPWARAWLSRPLVNELTPLILPRGDRQDIANVSVYEAKSLNEEALRALANRYQTPQIILARGRLREKDGEFLFSVQLIDAYLDGRSANRQRIDTSSGLDSEAALYDSQDGYGADGAGPAPQTSGQILAEAFFRGPNQDFPLLAQRAVESTVTKYASGWKEQTLVDHADVRPLTLTAWFGSLDEWADIRIALETTPLVRKMDVGVFTNQSAVIDLLVIGEEEQFKLALKQESLTVWQSKDGRWNIAHIERATQLQLEMEEVVYNPDEFSVGPTESDGLPLNGMESDPNALPIRAEAAPGTDITINDGTPMELELPAELFGSDEEPQGPPPGAPVALEPIGSEGDEDPAGSDGDLR